MPRDLVLRSARSGGGVLSVDVSSELLDEPAPKLQLAIAQIVFTASELEGVREVRVTVVGTIRPWPDGEGELRTVALDVSANMLDASGDSLVAAVAQIVYTLGQLDSVDGVQLRVEGELRQWPTGDGTLTSAPLDRVPVSGPRRIDASRTTRPCRPPRRRT